MAVSLTNITGLVLLPSGVTPTNGQVVFELTSWDKEEGEAVFATGPYVVDIDINGAIDIDLFTTTSGDRSVVYNMYVTYLDSRQYNEQFQHKKTDYIGQFALSGPGPFRISELNIVDDVTAGSFNLYAEMLALNDGVSSSITSATTEAISAATIAADLSATNASNSAISATLSETAAAASAAEAALYTSHWLDDVAAVLTNTSLTYTAGQSGTVVAGEIVQTRADRVSYEVAASGASDHHIETANGTPVKLYVRPGASGYNVVAFGALGDGTTDDTAAIQAAIDTTELVLVPETANYYKITSALSMTSVGQSIQGGGRGAQIRQVTSLANVLNVNADKCQVTGLHIWQSGDFSTTTDGAGIKVTANNCIVRENIFENTRGSGVVLTTAASYNIVSDNIFVNSTAVPGVPTAEVGVDIAVRRNASYNVISNNVMLSGNGTAILVQAIAAGENCLGNVIEGNTIKDYLTYGIVAYRNHQFSTDGALPAIMNVRRTVIANNTIENISGNVLGGTSAFDFGCGIYVQGAEQTAVTGNTIYGSHSAVVTFTELLSPGAIGFANTGRFTCTGNTITDSGMFGIYVGDGNELGDPIGGGVIANNIITNSTEEGIMLFKCGRKNVIGNFIDTASASGINVDGDSAASADYRSTINISGNTVKNITGLAGIEISETDDCIVSGNLIDTVSAIGISMVSGTTNGKISGNLVRAHSTRGIYIASSSGAGMSVTGNDIVGTGSSTEGIRADEITFLNGNKISGCTSAYIGAFSNVRKLQSTGVTGNVGVGEDDLLVYTLPGGTFQATNDAIKVIFSGSTANNANAKTLKVHIGSVTAITMTMTTSQAGAWRAEVILGKAGVNTQRATAQLWELGATSQQLGYAAQLTETEASDIIIKVTGEAVANNDVRCWVMDADYLPA